MNTLTSQNDAVTNLSSHHPSIQNASRFHLDLETMMTTHQLKTAVTSVAFSGPSPFLTSLSTSAKSDDLVGADVFIGLLSISLSNTLPGRDANDPHQTLAILNH